MWWRRMALGQRVLVSELGWWDIVPTGSAVLAFAVPVFVGVGL